MVLFDDVLDTAESQIKAWVDYPSVREVTLIRDVFGHVAVLISSVSPDHRALEQSLGQLSQDFQNTLGYYFSGRIYYKEKTRLNDLERKIIDEIERLRCQYSTDGTCTWYKLERTIAKKAWLDQVGNRQPVWEYEKACTGEKPKVVSFYSFKGGMGRTTSLTSSALVLAKKGYNVLAIDTDIEAPGLSSFFFDDSRIVKGTVDFFVEYQANESYAPDMRDYLIEVDDVSLKEGIPGEIFVIPAGRTDESYLSKLARIDYQDVKPDGMRNTVARLMENAVDFLQRIGKNVDYILLDARAGFHDMGGVVTFQIPHGIVLIGRDNRQSWSGLKEAIALAGTTQVGQIPFVLVDSMCDVIPSIARQQRDSFKAQAYTLCCDLYYLEGAPQPGIDATDEPHTPVFIPYNAALNEEICLYSDGSQKKNDQVIAARDALCGKTYQDLVQRICAWFGDVSEEGEECNAGTE